SIVDGSTPGMSSSTTNSSPLRYTSIGNDNVASPIEPPRLMRDRTRSNDANGSNDEIVMVAPPPRLSGRAFCVARDSRAAYRGIPSHNRLPGRDRRRGGWARLGSRPTGERPLQFVFATCIYVFDCGHSAGIRSNKLPEPGML